MWIERGEGERERERERVRVRTREKERSVRCEVTGRSRGPTFVSRTFLVCPLRTRARTYVCTYVDGAWMCWTWRGRESPKGGVVCGKRFPRFPRRDASPFAPRFSPFCCPLSGIQARACGLVHLIPQRAHTYTRSSEDHECTYTVHALSHHRKTVAVAGGWGGQRRHWTA